MVLEQKPKISKRLERLVRSGICPAEDVSKYASELRQLVHEITDENTVKTQSRLFKALADTTRLKIMMLLGIREMCVCEIMVALDLTQPTASHHLGILEAVDLVEDKHEGKWVFYSLGDKRFTNLMRVFMEK
ncbi:ArsR family transcriptional regulator [Candidatus Bathyarchaeota archaeon]|nr:MAG: ArsR family transcriptional regulator [Candidatus Bathyarchaeota archaeon]TET64923.1 MAG: ArsR family transcriptional regulator [Candidatus Bathyarchaeota archaeon]